MRRSSKSPDWQHVFGVPLVVACFSCSGLAAVFVFGEIGQWMSWAGLGLPLAVIIWVIARELCRKPR